ncbi:MAG: hypothetical protein JXC31_06385, partial [Acholeplasmataceae bacterium]|nr:hypothetical protein [Acholeplasmataceae bacterium]
FTVTTNVLSKDIVKDSSNQIIGELYHLRGSGIYDGIDAHVGTINIYIGLDLEGNILGVDLPKEEFGHTTTSQFYGKVISYAHSLVGSNIQSFEGDDDLVAGASNSKSLVDSLLNNLGEVLS